MMLITEYFENCFKIFKAVTLNFKLKLIDVKTSHENTYLGMEPHQNKVSEQSEQVDQHVHSVPQFIRNELYEDDSPPLMLRHKLKVTFDTANSFQVSPDETVSPCAKSILEESVQSVEDEPNTSSTEKLAEEEEDTTDSESVSLGSNVSNTEEKEKQEFNNLLHRVRRRVLLQMAFLFGTVLLALLFSLVHCNLTNCVRLPERGDEVKATPVVVDANSPHSPSLPLRKGSLQLAMLLLGLEAEYQESYHYPFEDDNIDVVVM